MNREGDRESRISFRFKPCPLDKYLIHQGH